MPYIIDLVIAALLVFFAWRGGSKGLILSLCGLAAAFVAFFAAMFLSDAFCEPVSGIIRPVITGSIQDAAQEVGDFAVGGTYTVGDLLDHLRENEQFQRFADFMEQAAADHALGQGSRSPVDALAGYLAKGIAKAVLFGIVFLGVQLIWFLVSHALDLAFDLPILSQVNFAGGLVFGLLKGALLVIVLVWLGQLAGLVPAEPGSPILSLFTVGRLGEMLASLPG